MTRQQINTEITQLGIARSELDLEGGMSEEVRKTKQAEIDQKVTRLKELLKSKGEDDEADKRTEN